MYTWAYVLRRLAGTVAIVAPLGLLIYLGSRYLAEDLPGGRYWLTIVLTVPLIGLLARYLLDGFRDGALPVGRSVFSRAAQPFSYWFSMVWFGLMAVLLLCLCLYAIGNLFWGGEMSGPLGEQGLLVPPAHR